MSFLLYLILALPQTKPPFPSPSPFKTSCVMRQIGMTRFDHQTGELSEVEDWYADCDVTYQGKKIWAGALPLAHPASYRDASEAVDDFRTKKAREIAKDYKEGKLKTEEK